MHEGDHILTGQNSIVQLTEPTGEVRVAGVQTPEAQSAPARAKPVADDAASDLDRVIADLNSGDAQTAPAAGVTGGGEGSFQPGLRVERISEGTSSFAAPPSGEIGSTAFTPAVNGQPAPAQEAPTEPPPANEAPRAAAGTAQGDEDAALPIALTGSDADGQVVAVTVTQLPANGTLLLADGRAVTPGQTLTPDEAANLSFRPAADFNGSTSLQFTVTDDSGAVSDPAATQIGLTPVNDAPVASGESVTGTFNTPLTLDLLANDRDVDGDALRIGSATLSDPSQGTLTVNPDNTLTFTPRLGFSGAVSIVYTVQDAAGASSQAAVALIDVPAGTPPSISVDAPALGNDTTPRVTGSTSATPGSTVTLTVTDSLGVQHTATALVAADGRYSTDLPALPEGGYVVLARVDDAGTGLSASASDTGTLDITPPAASLALDAVTADNVLNAAEAGGTVAITGRAGGDAAAGDTVTLQVNGKSFTGTVGAGGVFGIDVPGSDLAADAGRSLQASITLTDAAGNATTVTAQQGYRVNQAPQAVADTASVSEDSAALTGSATPGSPAQDRDADGDAFSVVGVAAGTVAAATGNVGSAVAGAWGTLVLQADGSYVYTPLPAVQALAAGQTATDTFTYTIGDTPGDRATATLTIQVVGANDAAQISGATSGTVSEDGVVLATGSLAATDVDGAASFTPQAATGTYGSFTVDAAGRWQYTLNNGAANVQALTSAQHPVETFTVTTADGTTATVSITVNGANEAPTATVTPASGSEDQAGVPITLAGSDADGSIASFTITAVPAHGSLLFGGSPVSTGSIISTSGGSATLSFVPDAHWNGSTSLSFIAIDNEGATSAQVTQSITVAAVNDAPVNGVPVSLALSEDTPQALVGISVSDADAGGAPISVTLSVPAGNGSLAGSSGGGVTVSNSGTGALTLTGSAADINAFIAGSGVVYTPAANATGTVTLTVSTSDLGNTGAGGVLVDVDEVTLTLAAVDDASVLVADSQSVAEDNTATGNVLSNDSDVDNSLSVASFSVVGVAGSFTAGQTATIAGVGTLTIVANGDYTFTPAADWNGAAPQVTYITNTGSSSTLDLTVTAVDDASVLTADSQTVAEDNAATGNVLSNDSDVDNALSVASFTIAGVAGIFTAGQTATIAGIGTLTIAANGDYTFTPAANWNG
ncbi:MAG: beta strand repeat-containing protein, partial [Pseudomonadota bacterium]